MNRFLELSLRRSKEKWSGEVPQGFLALRILFHKAFCPLCYPVSSTVRRGVDDTCRLG